MFELSRHIESLLLQHNCVIVPELGGFVTHYVGASYDPEEQTFLPPHRSIGFNPQLTLNDSILVQSYMQVYDASYPEALGLIHDAVEKIKEELRRTGEYELIGIGRLIVGLEGTYNFEPCEAGVVSPYLYGLVSFPLLPLGKCPTVATDKANRPTKAVSGNVRKKIAQQYTLQINKELIHYAAAAVIAVLFYFVWALPTGTSNHPIQQAAIFDGNFFQTSYSTTRTKVVQSPTTTVQKAPVAIAPAPTDNNKTSATTIQEATFTIVLASAISPKNATAYVEKLRKEGLSTVRVQTGRRMTRVIYGNYDTEQQARTAMQKMRTHAAFSESWIMALR